MDLPGLVWRCVRRSRRVPHRHWHFLPHTPRASAIRPTIGGRARPRGLHALRAIRHAPSSPVAAACRLVRVAGVLGLMAVAPSPVAPRSTPPSSGVTEVAAPIGVGAFAAGPADETLRPAASFASAIGPILASGLDLPTASDGDLPGPPVPGPPKPFAPDPPLQRWHGPQPPPPEPAPHPAMPVPEPPSGWLLPGGIAAMLLARRRHAKPDGRDRAEPSAGAAC